MSSLSDKIRELPTKPGCYLFKNKFRKIIYIGKAKSLRKRVKSYFEVGSLLVRTPTGGRRHSGMSPSGLRPNARVDEKTKAMVRQVFDVDFIVTSNELEALLLEAQLIKHHQPKYNIQLKGGERYAYLKISNDKYPCLVTVRKPEGSGQLFGPFASGEARQELMHIARRVFKIRTCAKPPRRKYSWLEFRRLLGPGSEKMTEEMYYENVKKVEELLRGKTADLLAQLQDEMKSLAAEQKYELAAVKRNQIAALEALAERQRVQLQKKYNQDVINYVKMGGEMVVQIFNINKGVVSGRKEFRLRGEEKLNKFVVQYYYDADIPQEIILPEILEEQNLVLKYLEKKAGRKVAISVPKKGDKKKLLQLLYENILARLKVGDSALAELQNKLSLPALPKIIECFDVSNLGESFLVGSMVQFRDGKPDKNNYRRFRIKTVRGQSDYDAMREIVYRRYHRLKLESALLPNLIIVDGGKPQLSAAMATLRKLGLQVSVIALAKKKEEIFVAGSMYPLRLPKKSAGLKLLQRVRNEAHRFAIKYHRLVRGKM